MEITELKITQVDFEMAVPVAYSKDGFIFEACAPFIESEYIDFRENVLSDVGVECVKVSVALPRMVKNAVCVRGFLLAMRQLDVVLTNTGFGVVSTQDTAPASQARVNALEENLRLLVLYHTRNTVYSLRATDEWADTEAAELCIPHLCWNYELMLTYAGYPVAYSNWRAIQPHIFVACKDVAENISPELMSVLVDVERHAHSESRWQRQLIADIQHTVAAFVSPNEPEYHKGIQRIMQYIERNIDKFPEYRDSDTYKAKHYKGYENTKDSKMFVF